MNLHGAGTKLKIFQIPNRISWPAQSCGVRFPAANQNRGNIEMELKVKRLLCLVICASLVIVSFGCRSGSGRGFGSCLRGGACSTCNPPAGQLIPNMMGGCNSGTCNGMEAPLGTPGAISMPGEGVPYYSDPGLNAAPSFSTPPTSQVYPGNDIYGGSGVPVMPPTVGPGN